MICIWTQETEIEWNLWIYQYVETSIKFTHEKRPFETQYNVYLKKMQIYAN